MFKQKKVNIIPLINGKPLATRPKKCKEFKYDTIVIGSGMGGMTTATALAKHGQKVCVLERHNGVPGGFTHVFKRKGYQWDVGVHAIGGNILEDHSLVFKTQYSNLSSGEKYAYRTNQKIAKDKNTIIMLHGMFNDSSNLEPLMIKLQGKLQTISISLKGFGNSSYNQPIKSFEELSEEIYLFMKETFPEIKQYFVFGHNIGSVISLYLCKKYPKTIKGAICLSFSQLQQLIVDKQFLMSYDFIKTNEKVIQDIDKAFKSLDLDLTNNINKINCHVSLLYGTSDHSKMEEGILIKSMIGNNCQIYGISNTNQYPFIENIDAIREKILYSVNKC